MTEYESVLDVLKHFNRRPHTLSEIVFLLKNKKNQASVSREIKRLIKTNQIERHEVRISKCTKLVLYTDKKA